MRKGYNDNEVEVQTDSFNLRIFSSILDETFRNYNTFIHGFPILSCYKYFLNWHSQMCFVMQVNAVVSLVNAEESC